MIRHRLQTAMRDAAMVKVVAAYVGMFFAEIADCRNAEQIELCDEIKINFEIISSY